MWRYQRPRKNQRSPTKLHQRTQPSWALVIFFPFGRAVLSFNCPYRTGLTAHYDRLSFNPVRVVARAAQQVAISNTGGSEIASFRSDQVISRQNGVHFVSGMQAFLTLCLLSRG